MTMPVRLARRLALAAFITVGVLVAGPPMPTVKGDGASDALRLRVKSLAFNIEQADARQVGKLTWRGGLVLSAPQAAFGGWSDLWVAADGSALRAVSDEGNWLVARLVHDRSGQLAGLADPQFGRLKGPDGTALRGKTLGDAESLAMLPDGSLLVGFERRHRILRYPAGDERQGAGLAGTPQAVEAPTGLAQAPANAGLEAMAALADGSLFLLAEAHIGKPGSTAGWIGTPRAGGLTWRPFHYALTDDFRPTGAAALADGDIIVAERAVSLAGGWRVRLARLRAAALAPGATVRAEELARLASPWVSENVEGIAARRGPAGETLLWLISDDNFNIFQHTVLLHFALAD
jgi:hypothetical protein